MNSNPKGNKQSPSDKKNPSQQQNQKRKQNNTERKQSFKRPRFIPPPPLNLQIPKSAYQEAPLDDVTAPLTPDDSDDEKENLLNYYYYIQGMDCSAAISEFKSSDLPTVTDTFLQSTLQRDEVKALRVNQLCAFLVSAQFSTAVDNYIQNANNIPAGLTAAGIKLAARNYSTIAKTFNIKTAKHCLEAGVISNIDTALNLASKFYKPTKSKPRKSSKTYKPKA
jgi:hypothetical protein